MRPNNQNKNRQRGRNNNGGRKHGNPLSRNYESNGPDVKVRGNAAHIAEKYVQLARDAQASGDSVMAENYLQHAEHYFRILSAAQPQNAPRPDQFNPDADGFEDDEPEINDRFSLPIQPNRYQQPEPAEAEAEPAAAPNATEAVAPAPAGGEGAQAAAQEGEGEGEGRRHRDRRPRRRSRAAGEQGGADPANAPQPEVGDLPAFITSGSAPTAAE